jgi:hypothetical protein
MGVRRVNEHQRLGDGVSHCGKQVLLHGKHLADAVNESAAKWIAEALALQSTRWREPARIRDSFARGVLCGAPISAALWLLVLWLLESLS